MKHKHTWGDWVQRTVTWGTGKNDTKGQPVLRTCHYRARLCSSLRCPKGQYGNGRTFVERPAVFDGVWYDAHGWYQR